MRTNHHLSSPMLVLYGIISRLIATMISHYKYLQMGDTIWLQEIP
jgi:hypothetical protein